MSRALDTLFADLPSRLSVEQLTDVLGLSDKTVTYRWLRDGRMPAIRLGGTWIIFRDDIKEHLEKNYNTKPGFDGTPPPSADEEQDSQTELEDEGSDEASDQEQEPASAAVSKDDRQPAESTGSRRGELQRIREWAKNNGYELSSRGRISHSIVNAYNEAQK
ncbi:Lsr2 family protein (plasmid) [Arthrobacter agilis]|uniref:Lsr2 family DNA-binding protein n=1 Tax=Arthrobacter agilis TaxID=37921 RepID=UPI0023655A5B|nr:histone-like nucleoid-structuring protein Lsr2 [Arthrobacter agilis]WDF35068.1 Lsr2 family protein [Arthrobacter agilis]